MFSVDACEQVHRRAALDPHEQRASVAQTQELGDRWQQVNDIFWLFVDRDYWLARWLVGWLVVPVVGKWVGVIGDS